MGLEIQRRWLAFALALCALTITPTAWADAAETTLYQLPAATHARGLTAAPDGGFWLVVDHGYEYPGAEGQFLGHWDPTGGLREFPLPSGREIGRPAIGPAGEVWLPGSMSNRRGYRVARVGRFSSPAGLADYALGNRVGRVNAVASMGGSVWFTASRRIDERARATIGRIAASGDGRVRQFPLPAHCWAGTLAAAANAVWFTESCWRHYSTRSGHRASINRIDQGGKITRYPISPRFDPISIATSPDGSVWFGESRIQGFRSSIGRVTPSGRVVEFPTPEAIWPDPIAVDLGGRLWFPSSTGGNATRALDSIGPAGDIGKPICLDTECKLEPTALATGPDGHIWFSAARVRTGGGGGGSVIAETQQIANEAGVIGRMSE